MALNIKEKQAIVAKLRQVAQSALSAVIADSCGVTVDKMTELRQASRNAGIYIRVVRNKLMRRVVEGTAFECLKNTFIGPTLVAFSHENPGAAARLFKSFAKDNTNFKLKTAAFKGEVMLAEQIDSLANMPTYDEAISKLMATIKEASAVKLVRTLNELRGKKEAA